REEHDPPFGGAVGRAVPAATNPRRRSDVDDAPGAALDHPGQERLASKECPLQVHVEQQRPLLRRQVRNAVGEEHPCDVDQHAGGPEPTLDLVAEPENIRFAADVTPERLRALDPRSGRLRALDILIGTRNTETLASET